MIPLSIRGIQQCVALTPAEDHLRSVAVCGCQFMPLTGAMAHEDQRLPVPGHLGVYLQAAASHGGPALAFRVRLASRLSISVGPASASLTSAALIWALRVPAPGPARAATRPVGQRSS